MYSTELQIPPYLRKEAKAPIEHARWYLDATDVRLAWFAKRGLRPHATVLKARKHCVEFLAAEVANLEIEKFFWSRRYGVAPQSGQSTKGKPCPPSLIATRKRKSRKSHQSNTPFQISTYEHNKI